LEALSELVDKIETKIFKTLNKVVMGWGGKTEEDNICGLSCKDCDSRQRVASVARR